MDESYSVLAPYYDALMTDIDYTGLADFYVSQIKKYAPEVPKKVLDLGCGTGSIAVLMAKKGFDMCCIDLSCDMLAAAQRKAEEERLKISFAEQDMCRLDCGGGYGCAICSFDGLNYLRSKDELFECFCRTRDALTDGGLFIFDMNTKYKYENVLSGNSFVYELDDVMLIWQNYYKKSTGVCDFYLTLFEKTGKNWRRSDEVQSQRAFSERTVKEGLAAAGFEVLETLSDIDGTPRDKTSERAVYICKRK